MPKPSKQQIVDELIKQIESGKKYGSVLSVSVRKWQFSERTFNRWWKVANQQHSTRQDAIKEKLAKVDEEAAVNARKKAIMTADERKEVLTKIANGELKIKKPFVIAGKIMEYPSSPDHMDIKNAIAELNKMEGDYAATKVDTHITGGNVSVIFEQSKGCEPLPE